MSKCSIGFIMDPVSKLKLEKDCSCDLMRTALGRGISVSYICADDIYVEDSVVMATVYEPVFEGRTGLRLKNGRDCVLQDFSALVIRRDPPFDMEYVYLTYILELIRDRVFMVNDPVGIRNVNEKFYTLNFADLIPDTMISKREEDIVRHLKKFDEGVVLKPLNFYGGGGVFRLRSEDVNKSELMRLATDNWRNSVVVQEFLPAIEEGKRIVLLGGEPISAYRKYVREGDFRTGSTGKGCEISERDFEICGRIKSFLLQNGLRLVALDVLDGHMLEINVTSPGTAWISCPGNSEKIIEYIEKNV